MKKRIPKNRPTRSLGAHKLISQIRDVNKRNLLRGYSSQLRLAGSDIAKIREKASIHDSAIIGSLLNGPHGLRYDTNNLVKRTSNEIFRLITFSPVPWRNEVAYTVGYLNSMSEIALEMLNKMRELIWLDNLDAEAALRCVLDLSKKYGASNYLSYKLAYIRTAKELSTTALDLITEIETEIGYRENASMHFSALENLSSKVSLFGVAQRRVSGLVGKVEDDFRKSISLSNFIPTPLDEGDVSGFLLRSTESSLLDTIYSVAVILNLQCRFAAVAAELKCALNSELREEILDYLTFAQREHSWAVVTDQYTSNDRSADISLNLYRISPAFLERKAFVRFRNNVDRIIGARLLGEIIGDRTYPDDSTPDEKAILLGNVASIIEGELPVPVDTFYRTYLFLKFIQDKTNFALLSDDDIKFVFENTLRLDVLLTEDEINTLYITASEENRSLIAVLALALYRAKSIDPDVDYDFRSDFIDYVNLKHSGSILDFINYLLEDSPDIAAYIVGSLDESTLEKMYTLVKNSSEASEIRAEILRAIGRRLNSIEFIIEADSISTRSALSKLQRYFDNSRMYVDSVAMKKWLDSNPTISTEQYRTLYPKIQALVSAVETDPGAEQNLIFLKIVDQNDFLLSQIAKDAFEQFCLNTEFGIQSYLGRRIRHNTLDGVTTDTVDSVFRKPEYNTFTTNSAMRRTAESWMVAYKQIIDGLRKDQLQFSPGGSLFNSNVDLEDSATKDNIRKLANSLRTIGAGELLNEMIIAFCWKQISPQLENAARYIRTTLLKEAHASIDKYFSGTFGVIESQIKAELREAVNSVLKKVADWFQVPQTGYISACVRELCQIILMEFNSSINFKFVGDALDKKFTGISVHRLYDCLAVLLKNAQKHGLPGSELLISANATQSNLESSLNVINVEISSQVSDSEFDRSKARIENAIESLETGKDMVTEGYTGIKKIKVITRASEGRHTVKCKFDSENKAITLGFSIHVEVPAKQSTLEEAL
jgi:hypothetical protein